MSRIAASYGYSFLFSGGNTSKPCPRTGERKERIVESMEDMFDPEDFMEKADSDWSKPGPGRSE